MKVQTGIRYMSNPDEEIDVWEVTPHLNTDYDVAVYDSPERVIEYFRDLAEEALDSLGHGDSRRDGIYGSVG